MTPITEAAGSPIVGSWVETLESSKELQLPVPSFSKAPRPGYLFGVSPLPSAREAPTLGSPKLFWGDERARLNDPDALALKPRPAKSHPLAEEASFPITIIEDHQFPSEVEESKLPAGLRRAWNERLGMTFGQFCSALVRSLPVAHAGGRLTIQREGKTLENALLELQLTCRDNNLPLGTISHELCFNEGDSCATYNTGEAQLSWPLERGLFSNALRLYAGLGITGVKLLANPPNGYSWAKCGFVPESDEDTWELFSTVKQQLENLDLPARTRELVQNLCEDHRPHTVWAISDLERIRVEVDGQNRALGRALLENVSYPCLFELDNRVARARFARNWRRV